jgi:hypothetical protein
MAGSNEDRGRSRRLGAKDRGWSSTGRVLGGWTIEKSGDALCDLHRSQGDEERWFVGLASIPRSMVSPGLTSKLASNPLARVFRFGPQTHLLGFSDLGLKTDRCGLVIWPTKSPWRFLGLCPKTKWAMVCRLCHRTDGRMKTERDMRRDLAACFTWKRVRLGIPSLASRLVEVGRRWCTWHHHRGCVEMKLKTDGSMWWTASDSSTPTLLFSLY